MRNLKTNRRLQRFYERNIIQYDEKVGLYFFYIHNTRIYEYNLIYIGKSDTNLYTRLQTYFTNGHNTKLAKYLREESERIFLRVLKFPLHRMPMIDYVEKQLIEKYNPECNIQHND